MSTVKMSMLEIYNEKVSDLLIKNESKITNEQRMGLKVREYPNKGFQIENLSTHIIKKYAQIEQLIDKGSRIRSVFATEMNQTSSRSHLII